MIGITFSIPLNHIQYLWRIYFCDGRMWKLHLHHTHLLCSSQHSYVYNLYVKFMTTLNIIIKYMCININIYVDFNKFTFSINPVYMCLRLNTWIWEATWELLEKIYSPLLSSHWQSIALHIQVRLCKLSPIPFMLACQLMQLLFRKPYYWHFTGAVILSGPEDTD